jgi:hypothetical protein
MIETERANAAVGGVPPEEKLRSKEIWRSLLFLVCPITCDGASGTSRV